MSRTYVIACGSSATEPGQGQELRLDLHGAHPNVQLKISDVSNAMAANVPDVLTVLLEVATYVYCADQAVSRGGSRDTGMRWYRRFEFHVPVRHPDIWSAEPVTSALRDTLNLLSDDEFEFHFTRLQNPPSVQLYLECIRTDFQADEVLLFSGGLDSLAGAVQEALVDGRRVALVSHRSAPKRDPLLQSLATEFIRRSPPQAVRHIPVWVTKDSDLVADYNQRTRSFLYAALAATVARMLGRDRFCFYENGVTSLNLPVSPQVVGARGTRSTHPQVLRRFAEFFSNLLGQTFDVQNPFVWKTKADIVRLICEHGCRDLVRQTMSCSRTVEATTLHTHCGRCSQCVDRRFATLAVGLSDDDEPATLYKLDLLLDPRPVGEARTMAESYVRVATEVDKMTDLQFFARFGEASRAIRHVGLPPHEAAERILDLYKRHVKDVCRVVDGAIGTYARELREGKLPDSCLLVFATTGPYRRAVPDDEPSTPTLRRDGDFWTVWFENEIARLKDSVGIRHLQRLIASPYQEVHCRDLVALDSGQAALPPPGSAGPVSDERSIREYVCRLRDLDDEIRDAESNKDIGRAEALREDRDRLQEHVLSITGLGGVPREASDDTERARQSVSKAIHRSLKSIDRRHPALARHLRKSLKPGRFWSYRPDPPVSWTTSS